MKTKLQKHPTLPNVFSQWQIAPKMFRITPNFNLKVPDKIDLEKLSKFDEDLNEAVNNAYLRNFSTQYDKTIRTRVDYLPIVADPESKKRENSEENRIPF